MLLQEQRPRDLDDEFPIGDEFTERVNGHSSVAVESRSMKVEREERRQLGIHDFIMPLRVKPCTSFIDRQCPDWRSGPENQWEMSTSWSETHHPPHRVSTPAVARTDTLRADSPDGQRTGIERE